MQTWKDQTLMLRLASRVELLPVAVQCVETAAGVFGLGREEALKLSLATEEIFEYLCQEVCRGGPVEIECRNGMYYSRVRFRFTASVLNLGGLNIAPAMVGDADEAPAQMGLMIAARSVHRLFIVDEKPDGVSLIIEQEKSYPRAPQGELPVPDGMNAVITTTPDTEALKQFAIRVAQAYPAPRSNPFFGYPGKVADMVEGGAYQAILAGTAKGDIAGGMLFRFHENRTVELFGPFVFSGSTADALAKRLLDACISKVVRTRAIGMMILNGVPASMGLHFEPLGDLKFNMENGESFPWHCYYRLLHEDPGAVVWTHEALYDYLEREYARMVLARDIRVLRNLGETRAGHSIFSAETERDLSTVKLRPIWPGADFAANIDRHVRMMQEERIRNVFFILDLGASWHAALVPGLLANGFRPEIILPFAGQADLVVFQHQACQTAQIPRGAADLKQ
jgi:hypothetical protein